MEKFADKPRISDRWSKKYYSEECRKIYSLLDISESDDDNVRILDQLSHPPTGVLMLYSHLNPTPSTKHVKGVVVYHRADADPVIVCQSYAHTLDCSVEEASILASRGILCLDENTEVTNALEGTILRVFCVDNKWYISTHKKIDGTTSRWAGPSFGELFYDIWGKDELRSHLIPGYCYVFLLRHPQNRVVCNIEKELLLVAAYEPSYNGKMRKMTRREMMFTIPASSPISHPYAVQALLLPSNIAELLKLASQVCALESTGLLVCNNEGKHVFKIVAPGYEQVRSIRGNEPSLHIGFLGALREDSHETVKTLKQLYPEEQFAFSEIEEALKNLAIKLLDLYNTRYVKNQYLRLNGSEHFIVSRAHELSVNQKLTPLAAISTILKTSSNAQVYSMLKLAGIHPSVSSSVSSSRGTN